MKRCGLVLLVLVLAGVFIAGCTQSPLPLVTPTTTPVTAAATTTTASQPSFSLGDVYFNEPYGYIFSNKTAGIERSFMVDNPAWGIDLKVLSLNNESLNNSWFTMDVTNTNSKKTDSFGYGGNFSFTEKQMIPMYNQGPYKITMKGNQVKVWFTVAKRNP
ncbi:hypothetical protein [Methanoregula sp.]|uniref:hypothetical protein n=1 Tax=Methanoregula sp. TaxID=2052170 RepID=UPI003566D3C1